MGKITATTDFTRLDPVSSRGRTDYTDKSTQKNKAGYPYPALFLYITNIARFRTIKQTLTVFFSFAASRQEQRRYHRAEQHQEQEQQVETQSNRVSQD